LQIQKPSGSVVITLVLILFGCAVIGTVLLVALAAIGGMPISTEMDIMGAVTDSNLKPFIKTGIGLNHLAIFSLSAVLFAIWSERSRWKSYFRFRPVAGELIMKFLLLLIVAYPLIGLSASLFEYIDLPEWASGVDDASIDSLMKLMAMDGVGDLVVNLIIVALLPAIGEELLFRGVIQNELVKRLTNPHVAIIIASVIFSGFHLQIQGFLPKLIIGLILGYSYYWTRSLWYAMIIHFANNAFQTLILFAIGDDMAIMESSSERPEILHILIGVIISCFLCYLLINHLRKILVGTNLKTP